MPDERKESWNNCNEMDSIIKVHAMLMINEVSDRIQQIQPEG